MNQPLYRLEHCGRGYMVRFAAGVGAKDHFVSGHHSRAERSAKAHLDAHAYRQKQAAKPTPTIAESKRELARLERELAELRGPSAAEAARAAQKLELDRRMGLAPPAAMQSTPYRLVLGGSEPAPPSQRPTTPPAAPAAPRPMPLAAGSDPRLAIMANYLPADDTAPNVRVESTPTRLTLSPVRRK